MNLDYVNLEYKNLDNLYFKSENASLDKEAVVSLQDRICFKSKKWSNFFDYPILKLFPMNMQFIETC